MNDKTPSLEEWRALYLAAQRIKELEPWEIMYEDELFAVQNPETGEIGYVSNMGAGGEHFSVAVYLGTPGIYGYFSIQEMARDEEFSLEVALAVPQLQAAFEDRAELLEQDRTVIKQLGLKFRGSKAWPQFRSHRPGFMPWLLEAAEARFLTHVLEQALDVVPRWEQLEEDEGLIPLEDGEIVVRVPHNHDGMLIWEDQAHQIPPWEGQRIKLGMDRGALAQLKQLPLLNQNVEIDLFLSPSGVHEKGKRPYFPYLLLLVEPKSAYILGMEMLAPEPTLQDMYGQIPALVVRLLLKLGGRPPEILIKAPILAQVLPPVTDDLGIKLKEVKRLRSMEMVQKSLMGHLRG